MNSEAHTQSNVWSFNCMLEKLLMMRRAYDTYLRKHQSSGDEPKINR